MIKKVLVFSLVVALAATSCKNKKEENPVAEQQAPVEQPAPQADEQEPVNPSVTFKDNQSIVLLGATDQMTYNTKEIRVKAGTKVTLTLKHLGNMPITTMGHNFVLLKQGTDIPKFAQKAVAAGVDNKYIPKMTKEVIASTDLIGGGAETTITFDAPAAGTYDFICTFPAHYVMMNGKFIVE